MLPVNIIDAIAGTTIKTTWVSSGAVASPICSTLRSGSETLVSSIAAVDSGNGHFYALHTLPTGGGWYVNEWLAVISPNTYANRQLVRAQRLEVD